MTTDTNADYTEIAASGSIGQKQQVIRKSTYEGGAHIPHVRTDTAAYIDFLLGDIDDSQFDLASAATLTGSLIDMNKYKLDSAALHIEISATSGTIDVDVLIYPSLDGVGRLPSTEATKTSIAAIATKTTNGLYSVKLNDSAIPHAPYYFADVVETAGSGGSCDVRLFITGQGAK